MVHYDFTVVNPGVSNPFGQHQFSESKRKAHSVFAEGEEGELSITIPKEFEVLEEKGLRISISNYFPITHRF